MPIRDKEDKVEQVINMEYNNDELVEIAQSIHSYHSVSSQKLALLSINIAQIFKTLPPDKLGKLSSINIDWTESYDLEVIVPKLDIKFYE